MHNQLNRSVATSKSLLNILASTSIDSKYEEHEEI